MVQQHGVSRTVAREAVLALANKGLVQARPGFRPVVVKPGYDTAITVVESVVAQLLGQPGGVRNLFDLRIMMEAALARQAALTASKTDIQRLKEALAANEAAIDNSAQFYATDTAFHGVLYEIPDNPVLPAVHRAYTTWLSAHWTKMPRMETRNRMNFEAHARIFDAVLLRDPDLAEEQLRAHLASAWQQVSTTFSDL
jgi:DNA-binding FadR family transcriptional regulator